MSASTNNLSRRSFLAGAGILTAGFAGAALTGCGPQQTKEGAADAPDGDGSAPGDAAPRSRRDLRAQSEG